MAIKKATTYYSNLRREVTRLSNMANKRLNRLISNDLQNTPSFKAWERGGSVRFGVKGKSNNEVQKEYWRVKHFLDDETSTVRGANRVLREIAENTGIKYHNLKDLKAKTKIFFQLASKVKQYLQSANKSAIALQYEKIWSAINNYVSISKMELDNIDNIDEHIQAIIKEMDKIEKIDDGTVEGLSENSIIWDYIDKGW